MAKVSLISSLTVFSYFIASINHNASASPLHHSYGTYGDRGDNGADKTVFAQGSPLSLDLSGQNGQRGRDGGSGRDAKCHKHKKDDKEADDSPKKGYDGEPGGNGGDGGDGGSLTVYYQNLEDLKQLYVYAAGGKGGRGGRGGIGGYGCNGGSNGSYGRNGARGRDGIFGKLFIINRNEPLAEINPKQEVKIADLIDTPILVSNNIWKTRQGASKLLAAGSVIDEIYQEFDRRVERNVQFVSPAASYFDSLINEKVTVSISELGELQLSFSDKVLVKGNLVEENNNAKFVIQHAIAASEASKLQISRIVISNAQKQLTLVDTAGKSDIINTKFKITYKSKDPAVRFNRFNQNRYDFKTIYEGEIAANAVKGDRRNFTIDLSQISIPSEYLQSKIPIKIELVAIRSLGDTSTKQKLSWEGEIVSINK